MKKTTTTSNKEKKREREWKKCVTCTSFVAANPTYTPPTPTPPPPVSLSKSFARPMILVVWHLWNIIGISKLLLSFNYADWLDENGYPSPRFWSRGFMILSPVSQSLLGHTHVSPKNSPLLSKFLSVCIIAKERLPLSNTCQRQGDTVSSSDRRVLAASFKLVSHLATLLADRNKPTGQMRPLM